MKNTIQTLLTQALSSLKTSGVIPSETSPEIQLTRTKDRAHGDFACNLAMTLAKPAAKNPRELAQLLIDSMPAHDDLDKVEIAGPGFINFFVKQSNTLSIIDTINTQAETFGLSNIGAGRKVQIEFVSANPTGPLHVGHGRGAAYGATVATLLSAVGFNVHSEYYVNDAGRQMDILGTSVWLRYLEQCGVDITFPSNAYKGEYVKDIAEQLFAQHDKNLMHPATAVYEDIPADEPDGGDKEIHIDALISRAKTLLGDESYRQVFDLGLNLILDDIRDDLKGFGVEFDEWFSERSLAGKGLIKQAVERLQAANYVYEKNGALWFKSTKFGDEKDRVVVRDNGQSTYFASDIAYHMDKLDRGFDRVIDIWGADHHGYIPRVKAALQALGNDVEKLDVLLVQFAILYRGGERVPMSTRSGSFVTLRELRAEVGNDAARFFYVLRKCEQHMDFDLDLAKSQSSDNPVYYIQYAHARICSVFRQVKEKQLTHDTKAGSESLNLLTEEHETSLVTSLAKYPEIVEKAALNEEPHLLAHYLRALANELHSSYNVQNYKFIVEDTNVRNARLSLINATRHVLHNGLKLLGVSAPENM
ncbi:MAG: arginine--tRNA ligase [endosymbiont of Galathealinum brachiosum]|uniref:Arginine--tRNA ligase n=1 Tax=endosymbiont of Galathealinum brachiosum TaxID=2200906 RepID=A0A370DCC7_9GAMM|nr:MAG: arginine--tRNA ligase [endosymbiont of Galathealinum brachiosum]